MAPCERIFVCARLFRCGVGTAPLARACVKTIALVLTLLAVSWVAAADASSSPDDKATVIVVVGAPGEEEYGKNFEKCAGLWEEASRMGGAKEISIGLKSVDETNDLERLRRTIDLEPKETVAELWLVLIGHGTFDGKQAKFNLRGPDLSATNLASWLQPFRRPVAVI